MLRYGIFGGTFNPPHIAHSILADDVREQMHLDKIIFIPSGIHPFKEENLDADAIHRLNMSKIAFESNPKFEVSDIELKNKEKKSYTVDTLMQLRELHKNDFIKFYLIIGIDNLIEFTKWKEPEKIFALAEVIVINRPGYLVTDVLPRFSERVKFLSVPMLDISSSMIRDYIMHKKSIKYLVLPGIEKYITDNNLYEKNK